MRIRGTLVLIVAASCAKPYRHAGDAPPLQVAGMYAMSETMYSNDCPPAVGRGIETRTKKIRVEVFNSAPSVLMKLTVDVEPFDGQVLPNGTFEVKPIASTRGSLTMSRSISGRFTSSGFAARYVIETREPLPQARPGPVEYRICKYNFRWEAEKL